ncbi:MAG: PTS fructose transporter subunit IIB [Tissierellia bacterium]|nr:PTS fructose transporter subunit IIB [Tissierellia bacterium]
MKVVGITACPTGIAHTYMAQENLEKECKKRGFDCKIETQGSLGIENELDMKDIENADLVILGIGIAIEGEERFIKKIVYETSVSECVTNPSKVLEEALVYYKECKNE